MSRNIGTSAYGLRTPIIKQGDNLAEIVVDTLIDSLDDIPAELKETDVVAITESLLARSQGNFCTIDQIAEDINSKFDDTVGVLFPIASRNRFSLILKAIAKTGKRVVVFLKYPVDEVGNRLLDEEVLINSGINLYTDVLNEEEYRELTGESYPHPFTGIDYVDLYKECAYNDNIEIYLSNNPLAILDYTDEILISSIHDRNKLKSMLKDKASKLYTLADIMNEAKDNSGYNPDYGLYGSNLAGKETLKLFPRNSEEFVYEVQQNIHQRTGVSPEVMIYGDGAFKDPVGGIWEFADPVVSPGFTSNLTGVPTEYKLKYLADNPDFPVDSRDELESVLKEKIKNKDGFDAKQEASLGTTPRRITDLLGSLSDLISGSGDKGTPVVLIKGYFDNFATE